MNNKDYSVIEVAFAGLIHDIGKFYQRTMKKSDLSDEEKLLTPFKQINQNYGFHTHLHAGYTSRFLKEILEINNKYEFDLSAHHINNDSYLTNIIKQSDYIASTIDRSEKRIEVSEDEMGDYITNRLSSIIGEVDFGKEKNIGSFKLNKLSEISYPIYPFYPKEKEEAAKEYEKLFNELKSKIDEDINIKGEVTKYSFDRMYALLKEYITTTPASTMESPKSSVSLFDHSKLTAAIASCIHLNKNNDTNFTMVEFDVSGIQNFIFKVTEGSEAKKSISKSLRGRSTYVSLITNFISYAILNEFNLTQANILFNTGGGALLLLPKNDDTRDRLKNITKEIQQGLYELTNTNLTFVLAHIDVNETELKQFKAEKALELKKILEDKKSRKFLNIMDNDFYISEIKNKKICPLCESVVIDKNKKECKLCEDMIEISNVYTKHDDLYVLFEFGNKINSEKISIDLKIGKIKLYSSFEKIKEKINKGNYDYIESVNNSYIGDFKNSGSHVPIKNEDIINFESISEQLIGDISGDKKLAILKMDVDDLGAMFAFGLQEKIEGIQEQKNYRSISKYVTLSRLFEIFFTIKLKEICKDVSIEINPKIKESTDNKTMFYINYAGGDDLVIVGPLYGILKLANEIYEKFNEFTLNKNITISGGIHVQKPKQPIRFGIGKSEEQLQKSKIEGKDRITLFDTSIKFNKNKNIIEKAEEYKNYIESDDIKVSRGLIYNIYNILITEGIDNFKKKKPILLYMIYRNVGKEYADNIKKDILDLTKNNEDEFNEYILVLKLALILSREG